MFRVMTFFTYRNYIKPMFRGIAFVVMVLLSRFFAFAAQQKKSTWKHSVTNCMVDSNTSLNSVRIFFSDSHHHRFAFFAFYIFFMALVQYFFAFFACFVAIFVLCALWASQPVSRMNSMTNLTITLMAAFVASFFVKITGWFDLIAFGTNKCYDCFRHFLFLSKRFCLGLVISTYLWPVRSILQHSLLMSRRISCG